MGAVADWLPDKRTVLAKDLGIEEDFVPGNPYCRYDTETGERKYCSSELWDQIEIEKRYIIPIEDSIPRPIVVCDVCGEESYQDSDGECGICGAPMFDCPKCGEEVHGRVDECPHCEAAYKWPDEGD